MNGNSEVITDLPNNSIKGDFYSVFVPGDIKPRGSEIYKYIFEDKNEALQMVKESKKARFKHFQYFHEAVNFATHGMVEQPRRTNAGLNGSIMKTSLTAVGEKFSPFKGPKPQELVQLRKAIERGDYDYVHKTIWANPRYLVSSGDTPSMLQEGFRYNALHVSAKSKNAPIAELILNTISNENFIKLLYGDDNIENTQNRIDVLLDLYLNTPDKGLNETPLHFAVKFGAVEVVEVLVSFPQCDKTLKNKYNQTADMIICDRCNNAPEAVKKKLSLLLDHFYYVPVLRAEDNSIAPMVGEPFSPGDAPVLNKDPLSPRLEIRAYAGPMNKEGAEQFRKVWKTPPRSIQKSLNELDAVNSLRFTDPDRGLERFGQKLANKFDVTWKEFWPFLDSFVDITSKEGLNLLEDYLGERYLNDSRRISFEESKRYGHSISDLCDAFKGFNINENNNSQQQYLNCNDVNDDSPVLYVERACEIFANRISNHILKLFLKEPNAIASVLKNEIKQLEQLIISYEEDKRFQCVNFQAVHYRISKLVADKVDFIENNFLEKIDEFIQDSNKTLDCFSSDDEGNYAIENKPTSHKKQIICIFQNISDLINLYSFIDDDNNDNNLNDITAIWRECKPCLCVFHPKKNRKNKLKFKKNPFDISRKLNFDDDCHFSRIYDSSDDEFFTPPTSPSIINESDGEETFEDPEYAGNVFLDGPNPSKTDCAVFNALTLQGCDINAKTYPNIYRWRHSISLYSKSERESWGNVEKIVASSPITCTPTRNNKISELNTSFGTPPSKSWLRITGANSPKAKI